MKTSTLDTVQPSDGLLTTDAHDGHPLPKIGGRDRHSSQIYWAMVDWITSSNARPGDRLPNEAELAERFAVSRPTIREALRVLEYSGLVTIRRGRNGGTFIGDGALPQVVGALRTLLLFDKGTITHFFEAREILETEVTRLAAKRITSEQLAILAGTMQSMERDLSIDAVVEANTVFHMTIADACENTILRAMMHALTNLLNELVRHAPNDQETVDLKLEGHRPIYDALARQDGDAAADAMRWHIRSMYDNVVATGRIAERVVRAVPDGSRAGT